MNKTNARLEQAIILALSVCFVIWSAAFIYQSSAIAMDGKRYFTLFDDAMISMRYAWNFSHGVGLVWNPGEYIQGYSNLLMTLLMSLSTLLFDKATAVLSIQICGIFFMLAIAFTSMRIANHFSQGESEQRQSFIRATVFFCTLTYYPLIFWSLLGMETGLQTLLCLLGVLSSLNYVKHRQPRTMLFVSVFFGLAYLTRNDTLIVAALSWLYILHGVVRSEARNTSIMHLWSGMGLYALFVIGQSVFQYSYYGEPLPNTYYLKLTGMPLADRVSNGIGYIKPFLKDMLFILAVSSLYVIVNYRKEKLLLFAIAIAAIGYQIFIGGEAFVFWRMLAPSVPFVLILFVCATVAFANTLLNTVKANNYFTRYPRLSKKWITDGCIVSLLLMGFLSINIDYLRWLYIARIAEGTKGLVHSINLSLIINDLTTSDASLGMEHAGLVPYYSGRKAIDFLGKCDRYIAHLPPDLSGKISWRGMYSVPGHNKYDLNYSIKTLQPTYVEVFKWGSQDVSHWAMDKYVLINFPGGGLYLLKDSPAVLWNKLSKLR